MASDPRRLEQLNMAGSFSLFDQKLRSSGNGSIVWGLINLLIGGSLIAANDRWGAVGLILGLALVIAGIYERTVRDPKVIIISAATLAVLALWDFVLIGLAAMGRAHLPVTGRTLFWGIAQAWGAFATWTTYSTYKMLQKNSDPLLVEQMRGYIAELKKAKPEQTVDLIQFDANAGFLKGTERYRLKPIDDAYLVARYKTQLGSSRLEELTFVPRNQVMLTPEGEKWMSKKMKAKLQLGSIKLDNVTITQEMAGRIDPTARMISIGT